MRRIVFAAAVAAIAAPAAPAFAQYGGSPDQQVDGPAPPAAVPERAVPEDQSDSDRDIDTDVDSDVDNDPENQADPYTSLDLGAPGGPPATTAPAPAARSDGYVRLRPGDRFDPGGTSSPYRPLVPRGPKDPDASAAEPAPDDQYDANESGPGDSADAFGKGEEPPDQPDDEESPPAR